MSYPYLVINPKWGKYVPDPNGELNNDGVIKKRTIGSMRIAKNWGDWCKKLKHVRGRKKGFKAIIWGEFTPTEKAKPQQAIKQKIQGKFSFQQGKYFKQRNVIAIDVDGSDVDVDVIVDRLEESGINYCLYTSYSYDPWDVKKLKFRIFIPIDKMLTGDAYKMAVIGVIEQYNLVGVDVGASKRTNMLMYLPECPIATSDDAYIEYRSDGVVANADGLISIGGFITDEQKSDSSITIQPPESVMEGDRHDYLKKVIARLYHGKSFKRWEMMAPMIEGLNQAFTDPLDNEQLQGLSRVIDSIKDGSDEKSNLQGSYYYCSAKDKFYDINNHGFLTLSALNNSWKHTFAGVEGGPPLASNVLLANEDTTIWDIGWSPCVYGDDSKQFYFRGVCRSALSSRARSDLFHPKQAA